MDLRTNYSRLTTLQAKDNKQVWQDCYTEDIVRRVSGLDPLVGRDACQKQVQAFLDSLKGPMKHDQIALAFDDENNVTIAEFDQSFSHKEFGDIAQRIVMVQRWRNDQIYDETIYVMPHTSD